MLLIQILSEDCLAPFHQVKCISILWPSISIPIYLTREMKTYVHKNNFKRIFIAALVMITPNLDTTPKATNRRIDKQALYTHKWNHSTIKRKKLQENGWLSKILSGTKEVSSQHNNHIIPLIQSPRSLVVLEIQTAIASGKAWGIDWDGELGNILGWWKCPRSWWGFRLIGYIHLSKFT